MQIQAVNQKQIQEKNKHFIVRKKEINSLHPQKMVLHFYPTRHFALVSKIQRSQRKGFEILSNKI